MKTLITLVIALAMFTALRTPAHGQEFHEWTWAEVGGDVKNDGGRAIAVDNQGSSYVTGYYQTDDKATFEDAKLAKIGMKDIFVAKYSAVGALQWITRAGSTGDDEGRGIAVDDKGNVYITGYYSGGAKFYSKGDADFKPLDGIANRDIFVAKFDKDGKILGVNRAGGEGDDEGAAIAYTDNKLFVTGYFENTANFSDNDVALASDGDRDVFIADYKNDNALTWTRKVKAGGADGADEGAGIAVFKSGKDLFVNITGYFTGRRATFGTKTINSRNNGQTERDIFVARYKYGATTYDVDWAQAAGGGVDDEGRGIAVNNIGGPCITGYYKSAKATFSNTIVTDNRGGMDAFVAQYDDKGTPLWVNRIASTGDDQGYAIAVDGSNQVYVTGTFSETAEFQTQSKVFKSITAKSKGKRDVFVAKYGNDLKFLGLTQQQEQQLLKRGYVPGTFLYGWPHLGRGDEDESGTGIAVLNMGFDKKLRQFIADVFITGDFSSKSILFVKKDPKTGALLNDGLSRDNKNAKTSDVFTARLEQKKIIAGITVFELSFRDVAGNDAYVNVGSPILDGLGEFTLEGWIRPSSLTGTQSLFGQQGAIELYLNGSTLVLNTPYGGSISTPLPSSPDPWYYVAAVGDSLSMQLYVNGYLAAVGSHSKLSSYGSSGYPTKIGSEVAEPVGGTFNGAIDEVRMWDRARTLDELRDTRHITLTGGEAGLIGCWRFDEGTGDTTVDLSGNDHTGMLVNGPEWLPATDPVGFGFSDTEVPAVGPVSFPLTDLDMNFTSNSSSNDTLVVSHIVQPPNITPVGALQSVMPEYWVVNRYSSLPPSFMTNLTFTLNDEQYVGDLDAIDPSHFKLFRRNDNADSDWTLLPNGSTADQQAAQITFDGIGGFSQFTFGTTGDSRLPVELAEFAATADDHSVYLHWRTGSEHYNAGFEIQRARGDDSLFRPIASYLNNPALVGLRDSTAGKVYNYIDADASLQSGVAYRYRLVDVSTDGIRTGHDEMIRTATIGAIVLPPGFFRVDPLLPNPVRDAFRLHFQVPEPELLSVEIISSDGRLMGTPIESREYATGEYTEVIPTGALPAGIYLVKISNQLRTKVQRLIVVR